MKRDTFIFYRSFWEAINELPENEQLPMIKAICAYALDGNEPKFKGMAKVIWTLIRPLLYKGWVKYLNGCKGGEHGIKGGAPKGNKNASRTTPKQPRNNPETTPYINKDINKDINLDINKDLSLEKKESLNNFLKIYLCQF